MRKESTVVCSLHFGGAKKMQNNGSRARENKCERRSKQLINLLLTSQHVCSLQIHFPNHDEALPSGREQQESVSCNSSQVCKLCKVVGQAERELFGTGPGSLESHHDCRVYGTRLSGKENRKVRQTVNFIVGERVPRAQK